MFRPSCSAATDALRCSYRRLLLFATAAPMRSSSTPLLPPHLSSSPYTCIRARTPHAYCRLLQTACKQGPPLPVRLALITAVFVLFRPTASLTHPIRPISIKLQKATDGTKPTPILFTAMRLGPSFTCQSHLHYHHHHAHIT